MDMTHVMTALAVFLQSAKNYSHESPSYIFCETNESESIFARKYFSILLMTCHYSLGFDCDCNHSHQLICVICSI